MLELFFVCYIFFFQAEDGIRDLVRSRGLGDVYKRQVCGFNLKKLKRKHIPKLRRKIGVVFQDFQLLTDLSLIHI